MNNILGGDNDKKEKDLDPLLEEIEELAEKIKEFEVEDDYDEE